eukprot:scaffold53562_cov36-Phaeocystis_antarctica.AAC.1
MEQRTSLLLASGWWGSMVKATPWQCPRSAPTPPQCAPGGSSWLGAPRREAGPLGAPPLPRVLERAASEAADVPAFDHSGGAPPATTSISSS